MYILPYQDVYQKVLANFENFVTVLTKPNLAMTPEFIKPRITTHNDSSSESFPEPVNSIQWNCVSHNLTPSQSEELESTQFWIDGVCQFMIGSIGIISNILAILILLRSRMIGSLFNKLLTCLLIFHTIYIGCELPVSYTHLTLPTTPYV